MAHDLMVGSLPAFAGGAVAMLIGAAMLHRVANAHRYPPCPQPKHAQPLPGAA